MTEEESEPQEILSYHAQKCYDLITDAYEVKSQVSGCTDPSQLKTLEDECSTIIRTAENGIRELTSQSKNWGGADASEADIYIERYGVAKVAAESALKDIP